MWKYQGQITEVYSSAKATTGVNNARELSSFFLEDGDYIRLTNTRLAYRVDRNLIKRFHISDLQLYVYGNNLLTWTNTKDLIRQVFPIAMCCVRVLITDDILLQEKLVSD